MAVLDLVLGPIVLGNFLNVWLYGIMVTQMTLYFSIHKGDKPWIKLMVAWLFLMDTLNTAFDMGFVYRYTVTYFGNFEAITHSHWLFHLEPLMTVMISTTTQSFFAWRIAQLTGRNWIGWCIAVMAFIQFLGGLGTTIGAFMVIDFARFADLKSTIVIWLTMSAVTDLVITSVLSWYLHTHRTGFPRTDDVISRLIRLTVQTGLLTTVWAVVDLILYLVFINNSLHLLLNLPLCKLYTNSLMSTLNSRGGWGSGISGTGSASGNGISIHVSAIREVDISGERSAPGDTVRMYPRRTGTVNSGKVDEGFELDHYAKSPRDVEDEGFGRKIPYNTTHMVRGVSAGNSDVLDGAKQVSFTHLHNSMSAANASEESLPASSSVYDRK